MQYNYYTEFLTSTILRWQHLLSDDRLKKIIIDALEWMTNERRCSVYAFVIMPNHMHLIWKIHSEFARQEVQGALLSYTAHEFKNFLGVHEKKKLNQHFVGDADRCYQFWERDSKVKECWNEEFLLQKLNYIHNNPCQPHWQLSGLPEEYKWSSAKFYLTGQTEFSWLKHYAHDYG